MTMPIENTALELFKQYGARSISIEDISLRAGVSKKTIYEKYGSKETLVIATLKNHFEYIKREIEIIQQSHLHPVISIVKLYAFIIREISLAQPIFIYSIKKYFPEAAEEYYRFQDEILMGDLLPLLNTAKKKGYIRKDVNTSLLIELNRKHFDNLFNGDPRKGNTTNYDALFRHIVINNLRGIMTKEAYHILDQDLQLNN